MERRTSRRISLLWPCVLTREDSSVPTLEGTVENISRDGALISIKVRPEVEVLKDKDEVRIAIPLNKNASFEPRCMRFEGAVVRCQETELDTLVAIQFDTAGIHKLPA